MSKTKFEDIEAIIFDSDGTIFFNSDNLHYSTNKWAFAKYNYELSEWEFVQRWMVDGSASPRLINELGLDIDYNKFKKEKSEYYKELCKEYLTLTPGVFELINAIHPYFSLIVASASYKEDVIAALEICELKDKFDDEFIFGAKEVTNLKPHPEIYLKAAEKLKVNPKNCLVFEDTEKGLMAAKGAGMYCIVSPNKFIAQYFKEDYSQADLIVRDFTKDNLNYSLFLPSIRP